MPFLETRGVRMFLTDDGETMEGLLGGAAPYILREHSRRYLAGLQRPVLSFYVDPERAATAADVLSHPASRTICFEGSGHWLHQERSIEVNHLIEAWMSSLPPAMP